MRQASSWGMTTSQLRLAIGRDSGDLVWSGAQVCNAASGHIRLGADGTFSTWRNGMTLINCPAPEGQPTIPGVVMDASLVRINGDKMAFYGEDGSTLATFEHVGASAGARDIPDTAEHLTFSPDGLTAAWFESDGVLPVLVVYDVSSGTELAREDLGVGDISGDPHLELTNTALFYRSGDSIMRFRWEVDDYPHVTGVCDC
jgi:hypothetical protein